MSDNDYRARSWAPIWCPVCGALILGSVHRCVVSTTNRYERKNDNG